MFGMFYKYMLLYFIHS